VSDTGGPPAGWYPDPSVPGGLRWWDGARWTEHTSLPDHVPPPASGPSLADQLAQQRTVGRYLRGFYVALAVAQVASAVAWLQVGPDFRDLLDWAFDADRLVNEDPPTLSGYNLVLQLSGLVGWGLAALQITWLWKSTAMARSLGLSTRRSPGLAGFSFIIPIVSLWWPYQSVADLFPPRHEARREVAWWWAFTLAMVVIAMGTSAASVFATSWALVGVVATAVVAVEVAVRGRRVVSLAQAAHEARCSELTTV
jgi:hypothetical protein